MFEALAALVRQQWDNQVFAGGLALGALGAVTASAPSEMTDDQAVWLVPGEGTHFLRHGRTWLWAGPISGCAVRRIGPAGARQGSPPSRELLHEPDDPRTEPVGAQRQVTLAG